MTDEDQAIAAATMHGMAFLVDGKFVDAMRVVVVTADGADNPIAAMRREKEEVQRLLVAVNNARAAEPVGVHAGSLPALREARKMHMDIALTHRKSEERFVKWGRPGQSKHHKFHADLHMSIVQALNQFFPVGDNDHIGEPFTSRLSEDDRPPL